MSPAEGAVTLPHRLTEAEPSLAQAAHRRVFMFQKPGGLPGADRVEIAVAGLAGRNLRDDQRLIDQPREQVELGRDERAGQVEVAAHRVHERQLGVRRNRCSATRELDDPTAALCLGMGVPETGGTLRRCAERDPDHPSVVQSHRDLVRLHPDELPAELVPEEVGAGEGADGRPGKVFRSGRAEEYLRSTMSVWKQVVCRKEIGERHIAEAKAHGRNGLSPKQSNQVIVAAAAKH